MKRDLLEELNGVRLVRIELDDDGRVFEVRKGLTVVGMYADILEALKEMDRHEHRTMDKGNV